MMVGVDVACEHWDVLVGMQLACVVGWGEGVWESGADRSSHSRHKLEEKLENSK